MKSDFTLAFNEILEARALPREVVLEALSQALVSAYKRDANIGNNQRVEAEIDLTGNSRILLEKEVVDSVFTDQTEKEILVIHLANMITRKIGLSLFDGEFEIGDVESAALLKLDAEMLEGVGEEVKKVVSDVAHLF